MKKNKFTIHSHQSGFTLLFAVLVSTLVVSISATIISIALRQTILSGTSRDSQYAFYAANTALDCAQYLDTKSLSVPNTFVFPAPGTPELAIPADNSSLVNEIACSGVKIITGEGNKDQPWNQAIGTGITTFKIKIINRAGSAIPNLPAYNYCADVTVTKTFDTTNGVVITRIEVRGYNTCDENNTRRVERSVISQYES
jgi:type II secretory pathway pseudopilin PulG